MSEIDLKKILDTSGSHTLSAVLEEKIRYSAIVNIYTVQGNSFKIKGDRNNYVIDITPDFITVHFDSHIADIMYTAIERIEYLGGKYGNNDYKKITKK